MSRKLSATENRLKAKEKEKQSHLSSSFLSSWLKENTNEDESNTEPVGKSAASSSAAQEPSVPGTIEELVSCETRVYCSDESKPLAKFVPCTAHTLNLIRVNAATAVHEVAGCFGTVNCLYTYFSASTNRWEALLKYSPLALKKESDIRWSSRREDVTVVHKHLDKITEDLNHLALDAVSSPEENSEAVSLLKSI
ncbi:hypothetical protein AVEN_159248-1 [Araneus ventricosus]|uniref:Uncharacterized protein n=1 Tax=Araneus ventricosus TaxID=182803 RepID=A0A4Y2A2G1_ARAVE|nr:hypothetical protein AVEN_159248-1 [Araneus ventricosus]